MSGATIFTSSASKKDLSVGVDSECEKWMRVCPKCVCACVCVSQYTERDRETCPREIGSLFGGDGRTAISKQATQCPKSRPLTIWFICATPWRYISSHERLIRRYSCTCSHRLPNKTMHTMIDEVRKHELSIARKCWTKTCISYRCKCYILRIELQQSLRGRCQPSNYTTDRYWSTRYNANSAFVVFRK